MLGTLLDQRYKVTAVLGAGGFGQTYIAEDTRRPGNPQCVVKHLKPASAETQFIEVARRLFQTEAEILEKLGCHDQIPQLLAYFEDQKEFYLVQEFIQGQSLSDEMPTGQQLPEAQVFSIVQEILNVLHFVHYHQVIHRDIKPDNLIRRQSDHHLVLIDFGAVKEIRTQMAMVEQSGYTVGIGTQGYMPGEQLSGRPRLNSDIYAVGMIGIKALTGIEPMHLPFDQQTAEIQWRSLVPQVTPEFAQILERMVRSQFNTRYQSVADILQDLQRLSQPVTSVIPPTELVKHDIPQPTANTDATNIPATNVVSPKLEPPQPARYSGWILAVLVGVLSLGGAYTFGWMPTISPLQGGTSDPTPSPSTSSPSVTSSPTASSAPTVSPTPSPAQGTISLPSHCQVTIKDLNPPANVRSSPDVNPNNVVATLDNDTPLTVIGSQAGWLQIQSPQGWVAKNLTQQTCRLSTQQVQFAPGATAISLAQILNPHDLQPFQLKAQAQQTMTVQLAQGTVDIQVLDPEGKLVAQADPQTPMAQAELPLDGDYTITVNNQQDSPQEFAVEVAVVSPQQGPSQSSPSRVQFAPDATGTQLNDTLQAGQLQRYVLQAGPEQQMRISLTQGEIQLTLLTPDGQPLGELNPQISDWQGQLSQPGDYLFEVIATQTGPYSLQIDIE